jgi:predicted metalloprotease with PDZ domain
MRQAGQSGQGDSSGSVCYWVSCPRPATGYLDVIVTLAAEGERRFEVFVPTWTPGSYRRRDHAARLEGLHARDESGRRRPVVSTAANQWRVDTGESEIVRIAYRVHAPDVDAAASIVSTEFALINGAATLLGVVGRTTRPHVLHVQRHPSWGSLTTSLRSADGEAARQTLLAADYQEVIDSLVFMGNPTIHRLVVAGVEVQLVTQGRESGWEAEPALADLEALCATVFEFWGEVPFDRYIYLDLAVERIGGLEHGSSSVLLTRRTALDEERLDWMGMASHELFHAWNGRDLWDPWRQADVLGEPRRRDLWVTEGVTSYYDHLLVHRAGLSTRAAFLDHLSALIRHLERSAGRRLRTLEQASLDIWEEMTPAERSRRTVSVYVKGALLAWLLDASLRRGSGGRTSLDDVMRTAYRDFGGHGESEPRQLEELLVAMDTDRSALRWLLETGLRTTEELDLSIALDWFGLELAPASGPERRLRVAAKTSKSQREQLDQWLGVDGSRPRPHPQ